MEITSRLESKASRENHFMSPGGAKVNSQAVSAPGTPILQDTTPHDSMHPPRMPPSNAEPTERLAPIGRAAPKLMWRRDRLRRSRAQLRRSVAPGAKKTCLPPRAV